MAKPFDHQSANTEHSFTGSSKRMKLLLAAILACAGVEGSSPGASILREQHADVLRQAENLSLPISLSSEELDALERVGPLLDSVRLEMGGMKKLTKKIRLILRGLELLQSDTLHTKPGMEAFRGTWEAITSSWGGSARMIPADAAVALAGVETSFRSANSSLSSASGLWQLTNPKPPSGAQERFENPTNYWQRTYNECFDKLDRIQNSELRKHTAGMLAHWLNNAHNVDRAPGSRDLQDIKVPLVIAQYLNGPSVLNRATGRSIHIVTQASAVGKNPPPRIYVARFAVYLAIVRASIEYTRREGTAVTDSKVLLAKQPIFLESVRRHLWQILTTPNFGIVVHYPSEPTMFERVSNLPGLKNYFKPLNTNYM